MKRTPPRRKSWLKRSTKPLRSCTPLRPFGKAKARKVKRYQKHIRSAAWKALRLEAFTRDGGLCQCPTCIDYRKQGGEPEDTRVEVWFDTRGRIHGFDTHHVTYVRFGNERLEDVLTMKREHHRAIERQHGHRRKFLSRSGSADTTTEE